MDGCEYFLEIIIVPLKKSNMLLRKNIFKRWMTARYPVHINKLFFKEWMTATLSVTKTDILLQKKDDCDYSGEINRLP